MSRQAQHPQRLSAAQVLFCGAAIVTLSMGIRHGFGLWLQPITQDQGWTRENFAFAMAVQNLAWGLFGIFAGMAADRFGAFKVLAAGAIAYALGLYGMATSTTPTMFALTAGVLIASLAPPPDDELTARHGRTASALSQASMNAYRALVYETPGFVDYFRAATPIAELSELKIGSRPASRTASTRIEDLRAIPWGFSWSQSRVMLPGWFGFGSAAEGADVEELKDMAANWPFFRTLIQNMEMIMAKSDMSIARRYASLVPDTALADRIYGAIHAEWRRTRDAVLRITEQTELLQGQPELDRLIRLRMPYVEPLNHVQIELIRRRRGGDDDPRVREGILLAVNGIAAGLRNSG